MKAYQVSSFGEPLALNNWSNPEPKGAEVLIKVTGCGVCHSDVHLWEGFFDLGGGRKLELQGGNNGLPFTLGHEIVGEVVAMGPDADGVAIGDQRVVYPWIGCGDCPVCDSGEEQLCGRPQALGINVDGGYADHVLVRDAKYLLDYTGLPKDLACTYACSGLTAYGALKKVAGLDARDSLVLIGAGGVGLAGVRLAKAVTGVAPIVADIDPVKLEAAKTAGAAEVIDSSDPQALKTLRGLTSGGAAAAIDFVGSDKSFSFGDRSLRKGGKLVIVGLFGGAVTLPVPLIPMRAITIQGSYVGSLQDMRELLDLVRSGEMNPMPVAPRPLEQATDTLTDLRDGKIVGRVVLQP